MSGHTVNARFGLEEMPPDRDRPLIYTWLVNLGAAVFVLIVVAALFGFCRGFLREYDDAIRGRVEAEARATRAEKQLAEMLKAGDQGILVANIGPDLSGYQLRLVPQKFNGRK